MLYIGVSKNHGHLVWTRNDSGSIRTPKNRTPPILETLMYESTQKKEGLGLPGKYPSSSGTPKLRDARASDMGLGDSLAGGSCNAWDHTVLLQNVPVPPAPGGGAPEVWSTYKPMRT